MNRSDGQVNSDAGEKSLRRLYVYNGGFLTKGRVRRILSLAGYDIKIGRPAEGDLVGVWGKSPTAPRGEKVADVTDTPVLRVEDALLRSVLPGRLRSPPIGLLLDSRGVHFDSSAPSDIENLLATHPLDDTFILNRARAAIERLRDSNLSKYNNFDPELPAPEPGYVLVVDQTLNDASINFGAANAATFREMLVFAQEEHPGAKIVIKTHPETNAGTREGHFGPDDENHRISLCSEPVSPWELLENARAVYTVSSGLGFEAIFAGHKPRVFGQPFYAGWGLTVDENPVARRERKLTRAQLFAAAMILYPTWYDPARDQLCELEDAIGALEAETRQWREDSAGYVAMAIRLWKRRPLQQFFGAHRAVKFEDFPRRASSAARAAGRRLMIWASHEDERIRDEAGDIPLVRVEDGFLRSRGLGAELVPPLSLVADDLGIYYDPSRESRLERLIARRTKLTEGQKLRAESLIFRLSKAELSKYNLEQPAVELPHPSKGQRVILVPGQVEDDASVRLGCGGVTTNAGLLQATRSANPDALILYKPHPDCESGLRKGGISDDQALQWADQIIHNAAPLPLVEASSEVWTMTSLLGFEALIRGKPVTCFGAPFYAGWGLTNDLGQVPKRRNARPELTGLVHAALIDYPRYFDPVSRTPCSVETVVDRLASGALPSQGTGARLLSKLQGLFASQAWLWRR